MDEETTVALAGGVILCICLMLLNPRFHRSPRRFKTRPINRRRYIHGFYKAYFLPMKMNDPQQFFKYTRMNVSIFEKLLRMVTPRLKKNRKLPDMICPEERLALTLHYFSQGSSMQSIAWTYHIGHSTVHYILKETANAIWEVLSETYLKAPSTEAEWLKIATDFNRLWNFPNCLGALDGKHVVIQAPPKSGSLYFNYKKTFSIVLLACCDANYFFTLIDIGAYGCESDGGIFRHSIFGKMLERNLLNVPRARKLPNSNVVQPFFMVADQAFPLKSYIMRPYAGRHLLPSQRIFNYRISRARRVIENAFGILVNRWRLLRNMMTANLENIEEFIKAMVCLHNFIKKESEAAGDYSYCPPGFVDADEQRGSWHDDIDALQSVGRLSANRAAELLYTLRDKLKDYFMSDSGKVPWQNNVVEAGLHPIPR